MSHLDIFLQDKNEVGQVRNKNNKLNISAIIKEEKEFNLMY